MTQPTFREFGIETIRTRLAKMLSFSDGVRSGDVDALHDMRVASRRLRAALSVCAPAFPDPDFFDLEDDVKAVTDALGQARDLDVMIGTLSGLLRQIPDTETAAVNRLIAEKKQQREKRQRKVSAALDRLVRRDLSARFDQLAERCEAHARWRAEAADLAALGGEE